MGDVSMFSYFAERVTAMQMDPDIHAYSTQQQRLDQASLAVTYQNGRAYHSARFKTDLKLPLPFGGVFKRAVTFVRQAGELGNNYQ